MRKINGITAKSSLVVSAVFVTMAIGGCATTKVSLEQRTQLDHTAQSMRGVESMLLVDGCVTRDAFGDAGDFIVKDSSIRAADNAMSSLADVLKAEGNRIVKASRPMICSALKTAANVQIADGLEAQPVEVTKVPIAVDDFIEEEKLPIVRSAMEQIADGISSKEFPVKLSLAEWELDELRNYGGVDKMWLARVNGTDVTGAASMAKGIFIGLLTALLTGGAAASTVVDSDGIAYEVALVDLNSGELLWGKRTVPVAADPHSADTFGAEWARSAVAPLYGAVN